MPLSRYGVLKGKVVGIDDSERTDAKPHVKIIVKCENDNRRREIVVNAKSQESPNKVLYVVDENYESIRFEYIPKLKDGFTLIKSGNEFTNKSEFINNIDQYKFNSEAEYNEFLNKIDRIGNISKEIAVDFIRKEVFNKCDMKILPHNLPGKNNDLFDFMINHMSKAMLKEANIYIYGEPYSSNNGMHDVHMNQGSGEGRFKKYNDIYQDGCIFLEFEDHWEAIFIAFQSQSWCTDENGNVEKECYLYDHHTSRPTGICKKINLDVPVETGSDNIIDIHTGFQEDFLGENHIIKLPELVGETKECALNDGEVFDYTHFSLVMSKKTKAAIYTVHHMRKGERPSIDGRPWRFDTRIGEENQMGKEIYSRLDNEKIWDRGHMVRRYAVCWGDYKTAKKASDDSCCYSNINIQHKHFNQDEWKKLEEHILEDLNNTNDKLTVFTGPIYTENDRILKPDSLDDPEISKKYRKTEFFPGFVRVPSAFWKIIFFVDTNDKLQSRAFLMKQDPFWNDKNGWRYLNLEEYQVTMTEISKLTGIKWEDKLYDTNPLFYYDNEITREEHIATPERILIESPEDIVMDRNFF